MIMNFLILPMIVINWLFIYCTFYKIFTNVNMEEYFNVSFKSPMVKLITYSVLLLFCVALYVGVTTPTPEDIDTDSFAMLLGQYSLYTAMAASWLWIFETYRKGVIHQWLADANIKLK